MSNGSTWIDAAFGKFKCWQRTCAHPQRLTKPQLRAAWQVWDLMRKTEQAAVQGEEDWAEQLHAQTVELAGSMDADLRKGPAIFSHWLVENREKLSSSLQRAVAESAQTTDSVSAQLIR